MSADPTPTTGPAEALAAEFLRLQEDGHTPDVEALADKLHDPTERAEFLTLVKASQAIHGVLPVQVRPGTVLAGRYRILREIGAGGMGKVFEALDEQLERRVAVKVLAVFGANSFDPEQLFRKEAKLLARLQHPNLVAVHEIGQEGDTNFIVMDLVPGKPLADVLESAARQQEAGGTRNGALLTDAIDEVTLEGRTSLVEDDWFRSVARISAAVTRTLEAAHAEGLVHRDIKPQNILIRADGSPVVLDFGLAGVRDRDGGDVTRGLFGSVAYLAPEQARSGQVGMDLRTDVYQLGAVLYEMLTCKRAFPGSSVTELLESISVGRFPEPRTVDRSIPFELQAICLKAMEVEPTRRYQSSREMADDLDRFVEGKQMPLAARGGMAATLGRRTRYFVRRNRALTVAAAALLLGVGVGSLLLEAAPENDERVRAFRYTPADVAQGGDSSLTFAESVDFVREGDVLGVVVSTEAPTWVYAVSVFGDMDPPSYLASMLSFPARPEDEAKLVFDGWAVQVPAGDTPLNCTKINASVDVAFEGLWVFTSEKPQPRLETWLAQLDKIALANVAAGESYRVGFDRARAAFDAAPDVERGGHVELDPAQRDDLGSRLTAALVMDPDEWPFTDLERFEVFFKVAAGE